MAGRANLDKPVDTGYPATTRILNYYIQGSRNHRSACDTNNIFCTESKTIIEEKNPPPGSGKLWPDS